jgi:hypothetical protein
MGTINNLSRSSALHITLHESNLLGTMKLVLKDTKLEVNRVQALVALAHVYAGACVHMHVCVYVCVCPL